MSKKIKIKNLDILHDSAKSFVNKIHVLWVAQKNKSGVSKMNLHVIFFVFFVQVIKKYFIRETFCVNTKYHDLYSYFYLTF